MVVGGHGTNPNPLRTIWETYWIQEASRIEDWRSHRIFFRGSSIFNPGGLSNATGLLKSIGSALFPSGSIAFIENGVGLEWSIQPVIHFLKPSLPETIRLTWSPSKLELIALRCCSYLATAKLMITAHQDNMIRRGGQLFHPMAASTDNLDGVIDSSKQISYQVQFTKEFCCDTLYSYTIFC